MKLPPVASMRPAGQDTGYSLEIGLCATEALIPIVVSALRRILLARPVVRLSAIQVARVDREHHARFLEEYSAEARRPGGSDLPGPVLEAKLAAAEAFLESHPDAVIVVAWCEAVRGGVG